MKDVPPHNTHFPPFALSHFKIPSGHALALLPPRQPLLSPSNSSAPPPVAYTVDSPTPPHVHQHAIAISASSHPNPSPRLRLRRPSLLPIPEDDKQAWQASGLPCHLRRVEKLRWNVRWREGVACLEMRMERRIEVGRLICQGLSDDYVEFDG